MGMMLGPSVLYCIGHTVAPEEYITASIVLFASLELL